MGIRVDAHGQRLAAASAAVFPSSGGLEHLCTQMRGVREKHSQTVTSFRRGGYIEKPEMRRELLEEVRSRNPWS